MFFLYVYIAQSLLQYNSLLSTPQRDERKKRLRFVRLFPLYFLFLTHMVAEQPQALSIIVNYRWNFSPTARALTGYFEVT